MTAASPPPTGDERPDDRVYVRVRSGPSAFVEFMCPGCRRRHAITSGPNAWTWNGDTVRPTFTPSVLVQPHDTLINEDLDLPELVAEGNRTRTPRCHSFVTDGRIEYLADSTHGLAGQTVDLPVWRPSDAE